MSKNCPTAPSFQPIFGTPKSCPSFLTEPKAKDMRIKVINYSEEVRKDNNQDIIFNTFILSCTEEINPGLLHPIKITVQSSEKSLQ